MKKMYPSSWWVRTLERVPGLSVPLLNLEWHDHDQENKIESCESFNMYKFESLTIQMCNYIIYFDDLLNRVNSLGDYLNFDTHVIGFLCWVWAVINL